jgi:hypothetical protein
MFKWMGGKTRSRLVAPGIVALLFAAGLAFSVFENTSLPRLMSSIGIGEEDEILAVPTDPRYDPYDCLFDPEALKDLTAVPHRSGESDDANSDLPANSSGTNTGSPAASGDDEGTTFAGNPDGSPTSSGGSAGSPGGSPSNGTTDDDGDTPRTSPHERNYESPCPGL